MSDALWVDAPILTRRAAIRAGVGALTTALYPQEMDARNGDADFTFIVANDLHYRDARCGEWLEQVVASIRALRPRPAFVVLNGDLSEDGTREQLGAVREIFRALPMPVLTTIGNHDYTAAETREPYQELFGRRLNYRFEYGDWQFLALDTTDGHRVYRAWVPGETLGWLDAHLPFVSRDRPLVVLTHFPLGRNWLRPLNARDVSARLKGFNLQAAISGHWHGWTERRVNGVRFATGRCCSWWRTNHDGSKCKGYFLCRVTSAGLRYDFTPVGPCEERGGEPYRG